ncbi:exodeoxyribonuclease VII large subunit [Mucilaginibacter flavidus]|uniref:exodeoxyribonuclease VII large subunit n=1 Tax=Mucilaginibacter flavidus TaxID=2949309 RepID=UPI0020931E40|nr:exodeoxyribonuclease VII large subunit [Mucilaginibacter flavidus]MCO5948077.1 exodeoxyribonuclease VII large subunit [Mucilaginibacter flavidus]
MPPTEHLRLSQLADKVEQTLNNAFNGMHFWVIADVTNHNHKADSNYHYFELVEKTSGTDKILAKFSAKAWGNGSRELALFGTRTGQKFTNNIQVLLQVKVTYQPTYGLQLEVTSIDPNFTLGVIEQQRQQTLERLCINNPESIQKRGEEYWTRNKSLSMPLVIQRMAVVCATGSAGWQDFKHTLDNNLYGYRFEISPYFTQVQGETNAIAMEEKLIAIFQSPIRFDVVVVIRGGGAQTDFLIFDHYRIGRAIARFPIPVITGIGHQKNITIADQMAHTSVKTPTKSAEFIINHNRTFQEQLLNIRKNLLIKAQQNLSARNSELNITKTHITNAAYQMLSSEKTYISDIVQVITGKGRSIPYLNRIALANISATLLTRPKIVVSEKSKDLQNLKINIIHYQKSLLTNTKGYLNHSISIFKAYSLENTLNRGFAVVSFNGRIISDPGVLQKGDNFTVRLKKTELSVTLQNKTSYDGN